ncbi:chloride channel [Phlyctochytrium arcticum]|nr:chloride channel [Phlyctochytrium arcticum]
MNEGVRPAPTLSKRVFLSHPVRASTLYNKALEAKQSDAPVQHYSSYESIAFEEPDGPGLRRHYRAQSRSMRIVQELLQYFLALIITLAICWLYIFLFFTSEKLADLRIETFAHSMEQGHTAEAVIFAIWTCLLAALIPATIILVFAPGVIGSGMVQLIAFLNGANSITKSTLLNMFARFFGVFGIATAGLYSGVDGPMAMIGASLAIFVVHCIRRLRVVRRWFYGERKDTDDDPAAKAGRNALFVFLEQSALRLYATLGAAVAISAIFRSPIGGVMFTLEETLSFFEPHIMVRTLFCTVIAFLVVGYEFARHLHSWTDVRIGQNSESWEITLFPTNVQCSRTNPLNAQTLLLQLLGWAAMGVCMAIVGTVWNRLLSAVQKIRTPYTLKFLDTQFANRASEKSSTTELETGKQSITQKTLNTLRNRSEMKFAGHSSKRWLFGTIRLFEVAVVCIITTLVVVLLPRTPGVDQCVPLSRTTAHVALRTPTECFQGVGINATSISDASLQECLEGFGGVCLPPDLKNVYQQVSPYRGYCEHYMLNTLLCSLEYHSQFLRHPAPKH